MHVLETLLSDLVKSDSEASTEALAERCPIFLSSLGEGLVCVFTAHLQGSRHLTRRAAKFASGDKRDTTRKVLCMLSVG